MSSQNLKPFSLHPLLYSFFDIIFSILCKFPGLHTYWVGKNCSDQAKCDYGELHSVTDIQYVVDIITNVILFSIEYCIPQGQFEVNLKPQNLNLINHLKNTKHVTIKDCSYT